MLRIEVILAVIASSIAIVGFMARAYANLRRGRRIQRYGRDASRSADAELTRIQEEIRAAEEMTQGKHHDPEV
jgi:hypothetical protein